MASIHFFTRSNNNPTKIAIRMYISRNIQPYSTTHLTINGKMWSDKKQRMKGVDEYSVWINETLEKLSSKLLQKFTMDYARGAITDSEWLSDCVDEIFNRPKGQEKKLSELIADFVKENPKIKGKSLSKGTLVNYTQLANAIKDCKDVLPINVNLNYHKEFMKFLKSQEYAPNTISKRFSTLKSFLKKINELYGISISPDVRTSLFYVPEEIEVDSVYLNEERVGEIAKLKVSSERLQKTKDNFVLGLRTGLRVSDFLNLQEYNIKGDFLEVQTQKTSQKVVIPIHKDVKEILERNNGLPENISDQKFNKYIKEICKLAGMDELVLGSKTTTIDGVTRKRFGEYPFYELVSSHICRRSFATNLYGHLPNLTIMQITGHKTESSFLRYIKITSREHAEKLRQYWEQM